MLRAILIDADQDASGQLCQLINQSGLRISLVGTAKSVLQGAKLLQKKRPDVVFLEVSLPDGSGFDLLDILPNPQFHLIILAKQDRFMRRAIKAGAFDYLLKPLDNIELQQTLQKLIRKREKRRILPSRIVLENNEGTHFIQPADIVKCVSDNNYTRIFCRDGRGIMISKPLKWMETQLSHDSFLRVHQSYLINLRDIQSYIKADGGGLLLSDGSITPVSRHKKQAILAFLSGGRRGR